MKCRVSGYAAGFEPTLTHRARESTALVETMRSAIERSGHIPADIDLVVTSAHATAVDDIEHDALAAVFSGVRSPMLLAPKAAWGECFAAHGALSVALAAALLSGPPTSTPEVAHDQPLATQRGAAPHRDAGRSPSVAMIHTLCYSGPTVALLLAREE